MTDSGTCKFVLGIELIDHEDGSVTLCQRRYVDDILRRFRHGRVQACGKSSRHQHKVLKFDPDSAATERLIVKPLVHSCT